MMPEISYIWTFLMSLVLARASFQVAVKPRRACGLIPYPSGAEVSSQQQRPD